LFRKRPHLLLRWPALDRNVDMNSLRTRSLHEARYLQRIEPQLKKQRRFTHLLKRRIRHWIEIEMHVIRAIDVVTLCIPLVKIDATEVDYPHQRRYILNHRKVD